MRDSFCRSLVGCARNPAFVFLTGDLGFKALEPLRAALRARFINAGIAEQNMISVAAGLARTGLRPWAYSIAPFVYARPFEQIRNDVCLHNLPVIIVGNGGGYGYGAMGATHHALEDYGALLTLPCLRVFVPAFDHDLETIVPHLFEIPYPAYLRLGISELPEGFCVPEYAPFRRLLSGGGPVLLGVGPLIGGIVDAARRLESALRPTIWLLSELPFPTPPPQFLVDIADAGHLCIVEEHAAHGGAGSMLASYLLAGGCAPRRFTHRAARGYVSGRFGSQKYHRKECGLDPENILDDLIGIRS